MTTLLLPLLSLVNFAASTPVLTERYYPQGTITSPANGTAIAPGAPFDFKYNARGDYCLSSYNFTVWLATEPPTGGIGPDTSFMTGHYFGRFSQESYPTNPWPVNPPPAQLVMPNFSISPGGFGTGKTASDVPMYLAVVEEYLECGATLGVSMGVTWNNVVYNATISS
ncbi:hypothetical protein PUNSTDRAFT_60385 [Punctularia strigosozonata HHB-11173 SS5]|uniref:uncharacterized protein n=1 Tax=Punctularia strigosozonata (strain HHB-11173) TaxID=741275 RepID=UPI0004416EEF|nr:uncharacterized protein PUNSTDRAFT_60385 [Punctularia strigosozonata HHB-11173 SS5]EIN12882.1 hypothetical protein PUNSTDRAFT_60385 [Punctularia strigosozonata HHB-11173 SS5]